MSMKWIRKSYNVPAKRGGRVKYTYPDPPKYGTIKSAKYGYLRILMDGEKFILPYHPTWELEYLDKETTT